MNGHINILLVEDNPGDIRLIEEFFKEVRDFDYKLKIANDLKTGFKDIENIEFDVILLDLTLPDSMGINTITRTRDKANELPIVVLTGDNDEEIARKAIQAGAQEYLIKGNGTGYGINMSGKSGNTIRNCLFTNFSSGIYLEKSDNNILMNNTLRYNGFLSDSFEGLCKDFQAKPSTIYIITGTNGIAVIESEGNINRFLTEQGLDVDKGWKTVIEDNGDYTLHGVKIAPPVNATEVVTKLEEDGITNTVEDE